MPQNLTMLSEQPVKNEKNNDGT